MVDFTTWRSLIDGAGVIPDSGIARFDYEEDTYTAIVDSWNNNNGVFNSGSPTYSTTSVYGTYGLSFDGNDDGATLPIGQSFFDAGGWTVSTWVRKDNTNTGNVNDVYLNYASGEVGLHYNNSNNSGGFEMSISGIFTAVGDENVGLQDYIHVVIAYDGSTGEFYVENSSEGTITANVSGGANKTYLGSSGGKAFAPGTFDRTDFYDKRLTETEISNLYNTGSISG